MSEEHEERVSPSQGEAGRSEGGGARGAASQPSLSSRSAINRILDVAVPVAVILLFVVAFFSANSKPIHGLVGEPAPPFKLPSRGGAAVSLDDFKGKVVLLDFWATWCEPCLRQMPRLAEAQEIIGPDLTVISVNVDEEVENRDGKIDAFMNTAKVDFDVLVDDGTAADLYRVESVPALVLVGPDGVVRYADSGVHETEVLVEKVQAVMEGGGV